MTAFVSIPNGDVDPESPITTGLIIALRDNPIAITEGASGAPKIQTAAITDANVTRVKLPTATVSLAGSIAADAVKDLELNAYMFFPMFHTTRSGVNVMVMMGHLTDGASADSARMGIKNLDVSNAHTYDFDYRYINS